MKYRHSPENSCREVGQEESSGSHFPLDLVRISILVLIERVTTHLRADRDLRKHVEDQVHNTGVQEDGGDEAEPLVGLLVVEAAEAADVLQRTYSIRRVSRVVEAYQI